MAATANASPVKWAAKILAIRLLTTTEVILSLQRGDQHSVSFVSTDWLAEQLPQVGGFYCWHEDGSQTYQARQ